MTREPQPPQPPPPAASTVGVDGDSETRAAEHTDRVEDERRQQELDYAELGGEG